MICLPDWFGVVAVSLFIGGDGAVGKPTETPVVHAEEFDDCISL